MLLCQELLSLLHHHDFLSMFSEFNLFLLVYKLVELFLCHWKYLIKPSEHKTFEKVIRNTQDWRSMRFRISLNLMRRNVSFMRHLLAKLAYCLWSWNVWNKVTGLVLKILRQSLSLRIQDLRGTRPIFVIFRVSWRRWLLTHSIFSSFICRYSFLISYWIKVTSESFSFDKRMLHCHHRSPSLIFINLKYAFQKINKGVHRVYLTLWYLRSECIWIDKVTISLSLYKLSCKLLLEKSLFQIL